MYWVLRLQVAGCRLQVQKSSDFMPGSSSRIQEWRQNEYVVEGSTLLNRIHSPFGNGPAHPRLGPRAQGVGFTALKKFNVSKYMVDCNQEMGIKELFKPEQEPNFAELEEVLRSLRVPSTPPVTHNPPTTPS